ncbi:YHS domain-containing protein OS=Sphingobium scionense OX=1404341 GN=GGQ90_005714 PE=4 SV=1 [Sphingobium scionense]|uniref:YHS domain-containing protein n=2 Tax=Sphingobium scionense TaxID=1404341 RepID=A0A7W6PXT9_9SPHN|nr:YHS domain-containing protein [Sphingobium scionense]
MTVDPATAKHQHELGETKYYFCSAGCKAKFASNPDRYLNPAGTDPAVLHPAMGTLPQAAEGSVWTCPMHPEVRRSGPDSCPICGMALEPLEPTLDEGPNPELIDFTRRFADQRQLVRAMSRDRGKDMAGDYARPEQDQARAFADRREIRFPELARQVAEKVRDKARGMFAGFRPKPTSEKTTSPERIAADRPLAPSQARAIERYGRAAADIGRMREKGLPVLAHQEQALAKAGDALDQVRPNGARDLASAIERDPQLARAAAEGNTGGAAKAMEVERQVRIDPEKRAGRFVEQWQDMKAARASMERAGDRAGAEKLGKRMESIAGGLHRDPQLESALKRHAPELALNMERGRSIGQELAQSVGQGRDRDRGMSR